MPPEIYPLRPKKIYWKIKRHKKQTGNIKKAGPGLAPRPRYGHPPPALRNSIILHIRLFTIGTICHFCFRFAKRMSAVGTIRSIIAAFFQGFSNAFMHRFFVFRFFYFFFNSLISETTHFLSFRLSANHKNFPGLIRSRAFPRMPGKPTAAWLLFRGKSSTHHFLECFFV